MAKTQRARKKQEAKRLRNKYRRIASDARKGTPGAEEKRQQLDTRLKMLDIRRNA